MGSYCQALEGNQEHWQYSVMLRGLVYRIPLATNSKMREPFLVLGIFLGSVWCPVREYAFFSTAFIIFSKIDHILEHKASLNMNVGKLK